jgi:RimJ/RimL family protein N-acetyltransferase
MMRNHHPTSIPAPELITPRLRLRGPVIEDFPMSDRMWRDEDVTRFITGTASTPAESWSRLLRNIGHWHALGFGYWIVEDKTTGAFLGEVGLADFRRDMTPALGGVPEIGWVLNRQAHGRGIATEAALAVVGWADEALVAPKTVCIFDPEHLASLRVASKLGYVQRHMATFKNKPTLVMQRFRHG